MQMRRQGSEASLVLVSPTRLTPTEQALWRWNLACVVAHLLQAVLALVLSFTMSVNANFRIPLQTSFMDWTFQNDTLVSAVPALQQVALLPFSAVATSCCFISAFAHTSVLVWFRCYIGQLRRGINRFRWIEYAVSSSIMMALIAMLVGVYDILLLVTLMALNTTMIFMGDLMEITNEAHSHGEAAPLTVNAARPVQWWPFLYGSFAGIIPWCVVFTYVGAIPAGKLPGFVWAIIWAYLSLFLSFPLNMFLQYKGIGWWNDRRYSAERRGGYLFGEKVYQLLSLSSKSILLWLIIGGVNQPNCFSGSTCSDTV